MTKRLTIIGGGAAGMFCAVNVARMVPDLEVTVFEKTSKLLSKVRISGGGRCNVTHACFSNAELVKKYPRGSNFLKKAFQHFSVKDTIEWFESRGVKLKTEADGRMFPETDSSETIIRCLLAEAEKYKVKILLNTALPPMGGGVTHNPKSDELIFSLSTPNSPSFGGGWGGGL